MGSPSDGPTLDHADVESARAAASSAKVERVMASWTNFVREQDRICDEHRFAAAMLTIGLDTDRDLEPTIDALGGVLRSTDRAGVLCATELAVLLVPLDSIHHAQRLVHVIDSALRAARLTPHIGWAMRLENHGLFHAAARADAAMLSARGHGRASVDLSDH
jgi:hypothetical protein